MKTILFASLYLSLLNSCTDFLVSSSICNDQKSVNLGLENGVYIMSSLSLYSTPEHSDVTISSSQEKNNLYTIEFADSEIFKMKTCSINSKIFGEIKNDDNTYSIYQLHHDDNMDLNIEAVSFDVKKLKELKIEISEEDSLFIKGIIKNSEDSIITEKLLKAATVEKEYKYILYR